MVQLFLKDRTSPSNYRYISILPTPNMINEEKIKDATYAIAKRKP